MKALYHAWELGHDSWRDFAKTLIISDEVTVWGASHDQVMNANLNHGFPYTPDQFLTLVKEGIINIAARTKWLTEPGHREDLKNNGLELTRWVDSFDGVIRDYIGEQNVTALEPTNVDPWVDAQITNGTSNAMHASEFIRNNEYTENWYQLAKNRLKKEPSQDDLVRLLLTTARNHHIASEQLGCDTSIENWGSPHYLAEIGVNANERGIIPAITSSKKNRFTLEEALYSISRLSEKSKGSFSQHVDGLKELRESGLSEFLQMNRCSTVEIESGIISKLIKKIDSAKKNEGNTIGKSNLIVDSLSYLCSIFLASTASHNALETVPAKVTRRELLLYGAAFAATTEIAVRGRRALATIRSEPNIRLSSVERASLILVNGKPFDEKVSVSIAEDFVKILEKFSYKKPQRST